MMSYEPVFPWRVLGISIHGIFVILREDTKESFQQCFRKCRGGWNIFGKSEEEYLSIGEVSFTIILFSI